MDDDNNKLVMAADVEDSSDTSMTDNGTGVELLPSCVKSLLNEQQMKKVDPNSLVKITRCRKCGLEPRMASYARNFSQDLCIIMHCVNKRCPNWFCCLACKQSIDRRRVKRHFSTHDTTSHYETEQPIDDESIECPPLSFQ